MPRRRKYLAHPCSGRVGDADGDKLPHWSLGQGGAHANGPAAVVHAHPSAGAALWERYPQNPCALISPVVRRRRRSVQS